VGGLHPGVDPLAERICGRGLDVSSNGQSMMPGGFGESLEPAQVTSLVAYLMTLK
jgi:hypothetical protein